MNGFYLVNYSKEEKEKINKAYEFANIMHSGQMRESGEDYITHPVAVAETLIKMNADIDTVCAALLHDTLEDTKATKNEIKELFNETVAELVDGVTKMKKIDFVNKTECNLANTRKIILTTTKDIRILIIKLADRLHNMETLFYKENLKQKENALETLELFVPLAYHIGAYDLKEKLENLAFRYLDYDNYQKLYNEINKITLDNEVLLRDMSYDLEIALNKEKINNDIKFRVKNLYSTYKNIQNGYKLQEIHDLFAIKILVEKQENCYKTLGIIHEKYNPINSKFKDYICNPKTNLYKSLHSTIFAPNNLLVQMQIRTYEMDLFAKNGVGAYWQLNRENAHKLMNKTSFQFQNTIETIDKNYDKPSEFIDHIKDELLTNKIYVYVDNGKIIELPKGASAIDAAYAINSDLGDKLVGVKVNEEEKGITYKLNNKDRVAFSVNEFSNGPQIEWLDSSVTTKAKQKILEFRRNS